MPQRSDVRSACGLFEGVGAVAAGHERIVLAGPIPPGRDADVERRLLHYRRLCTGLPPVPLPSVAALQLIRAAAPHAGAVLDAVQGRIALAQGVGAKALVLPPLLLVGPPGSGKTWLAQQLAAALFGASVLLYPCAGLSSAIPLKGQSRAFHESGPGVAVDLLARHGTAGGCIVWDGIDKVGTSTWNGDPLQALVQMLEPETSRSLYDDFLQATVDLSLVSHIATANRSDGLSAPLLSRLLVLRLEPPEGEALRRVVTGFRVELARQLRVPPERLPDLDDLALRRLHRQPGSRLDLRDLRRCYEAEILKRLQTGAGVPFLSSPSAFHEQ